MAEVSFQEQVQIFAAGAGLPLERVEESAALLLVENKRNNTGVYLITVTPYEALWEFTCGSHYTQKEGEEEGISKEVLISALKMNPSFGLLSWGVVTSSLGITLALTMNVPLNRLTPATFKEVCVYLFNVVSAFDKTEGRLEVVAEKAPSEPSRPKEVESLLVADQLKVDSISGCVWPARPKYGNPN